MFALISSASSVSLIFFTFVHFLRVTFVPLTASSLVSWMVSPDERVFPNALTVMRGSDIERYDLVYSVSSFCHSCVGRNPDFRAYLLPYFYD